mgnify:CR=1 FL=1
MPRAKSYRVVEEFRVPNPLRYMQLHATHKANIETDDLHVNGAFVMSENKKNLVVSFVRLTQTKKGEKRDWLLVSIDKRRITQYAKIGL